MENQSIKKNENFLKLQQSLLLKSKLDENCILHKSLTLLANKWTLLVIMTLMQGTKRTNEIQKQISGVSPKVLNETLKKLISYGLINRTVYPEVPPRVEYSLTKFGISMADPLAALLEWSLENELLVNDIYKNKG